MYDDYEYILLVIHLSYTRPINSHMIYAQTTFVDSFLSEELVSDSKEHGNPSQHSSSLPDVATRAGHGGGRW